MILNMIFSSSLPPDIKVNYMCYYLDHKPDMCISESSIPLLYPVVFATYFFGKQKEHQKTKITSLRIKMWYPTIVLTEPDNH